MQRPISARVQGALLVLITLAVYSPALFHGFIWDDYPHILMNGLLPRSDGLSRIWFHLDFQQYLPLQLTTHWFEYRLWGTHPLGYHAVNIVLHAFAGVLLWRVLLALDVPAAWLCAAVFLVHPVNAETAAYITERRNLLSAVFYFLALLCWFRFEAREEKRWYAAALLCFLLGLFSKTIVCSLPVVILLLRWMRGLPIRVKELACTVPFFIVALPLALLTAFMERYLIGANGYEWAFTFPQRILICCHSLWFYLGKALWPVNLMFFYPRWHIDTADWHQWAYVATTVLLVLSLIPITRRFGRRPAAALIYFGLTLFPALGFANVYPQRFSFVANHFEYLATVGIITLIVGILHALYERALIASPRLREARYTPLFANAALPVLLSLLLLHYLPALKNDETLYADILSKNNDCWIAHVNTGVALYNRGDYAASTRHLEEAHRIVPHEVEVMKDLGENYQRQGRFADARRIFEAGIADSPALQMIANARDRDNFIAGRGFLNVYEVQRILATMDMELGLARLDRNERQWDDAELHLKRAAELRPSSIQPVLARAELLAERGKLPDALAECDRAAQMNASSGQPFLTKGELLRGSSASRASAAALAQAETAFREALKREPTLAAASTALCDVLLQKRDVAGAETVARAALNAGTPNAQMNIVLARVLQAKGDLNGAAQAYNRALELEPKNVPALSGFASLCLQGNRGSLAEALLRQALEIAPDSLSDRENLAIALAQQSKYDEAIAILNACREKSRSVSIVVNLKRLLMRARRFSEAATLLREMQKDATLPLNDQIRAKRDLAFLLATCPDEKVRDGAEALRLAREVAGAQPDPAAKGADRADALGVLAAAEAEAGDFAAAVKTSEEAIAKLTSPEQKPLVEELLARQKAFESGKPWRW